MFMDLNLKGKKILVTAGTKGIGYAVVTLFKEHGACVITTARTRPSSVPEELFVEADLTTTHGCDTVVEAVNSRLERKSLSVSI